MRAEGRAMPPARSSSELLSLLIPLETMLKEERGLEGKAALPPCPWQTPIARSMLAQRQGVMGVALQRIPNLPRSRRGVKHRQQQAVIYKADMPFQVTYR